MKILHFADLHLGVETYGHINPDTGLPTRMEDFLRAFDQVVDYAIDNRVDLVLFCGDAYKSREPTPTQQREFARRIKRLSVSGIPVFLLVGNHDLPNAIGRATTTEIFDILSVENVYVANRPGICQLPTAGGAVQVVALPWLRRSTLLSRDDAKNLDFARLNERIQGLLTDIIADQAAKLDPALPAVLAAHVWVMGARVGSEKSMTIGQEHVLLLSNVAHPAFDYIALGHIHKHQVLSENPPVVYSGSLERLDFGEEEDDKGFCVVDIETGEKCGRRASCTFHKVEGRRFLTFNIDIEPQDADPTATVLQPLRAQSDRLKDAIVRVNISLPAELVGGLRDADIRNAVKDAHYSTITRDVVRLRRTRLGNWTAEEITPAQALRAYLDSKFSPERAKVLLEHGEKLIQERTKQS